GKACERLLVDDRLAPGGEARLAGQLDRHALWATPIERQDVVARRFGPPQILHCPQLLGIRRREIIRLREVLVDVVELPLCLIDVEAFAVWLPWREGQRG